MSEKKYTRLDPSQIVKREHDQLAEAKRVKMVDTEMEINVSHEDGDSVLSLPAARSMAVSEGLEIDAMHYREIILEAPNALEMEWTIDGINWHRKMVPPWEICPIFAQKIRFKGDGIILMRS